jgi:hypothetical protein
LFHGMTTRLMFVAGGFMPPGRFSDESDTLLSVAGGFMPPDDSWRMSESAGSGPQSGPATPPLRSGGGSLSSGAFPRRSAAVTCGKNKDPKCRSAWREAYYVICSLRAEDIRRSRRDAVEKSGWRPECPSNSTMPARGASAHSATTRWGAVEPVLSEVEGSLRSGAGKAGSVGGKGGC